MSRSGNNVADKVLKGCHMMTSVSIAEDDYVNKGSKNYVIFV